MLLASFDDEHISSHLSHTIELVTTSRASEDQVGSLKHDSDALEEAEPDTKNDTVEKISAVVPAISSNLKAGTTTQRVLPANISKNKAKTLDWHIFLTI